MIHSMTAWGSGQSETAQASLTIELRSVNSRFLDLHFRIADDLRFLETPLREQITRTIVRGKVDVRVTSGLRDDPDEGRVDADRLMQLAQQLAAVRQVIPDVAAPRLHEILRDPVAARPDVPDASSWTAMAAQATNLALDQLQAARRREGQRLAGMMKTTAAAMQRILGEVDQRMPELIRLQQERITARLRESLEQAAPDGFTHIPGAELSARIAQEISLFSLRNDVAEELARLRSHLQELEHLLDDAPRTPARHERPGPAGADTRPGGQGKRLDFLCQEMNREANTLGSKAAGLDITRAAMDLKLLIEQLREQAQNIE